MKERRFARICVVSFALFSLLAMVANTALSIWLCWRYIYAQGALAPLLVMVIWTGLHPVLAQWVIQHSLSWNWGDDDDDDESPEVFPLPPLRGFEVSGR